MITAGRLTERVTIMTPKVRRGDMGQQDVVFEPRKMVWANVVFSKGKNAITAGDSWLTNTVVVTIRDTKDVTDRCRMKWDGKTYRIVSLNRSKTDGSVTITADYIEEGGEYEQ
jgi:SPP1 family predicted phage head-tail adaptor